MRLKTFTIPVFSPGDADEEVNRFLAAHRIIEVRRELVQAQGQSAWAVCVSYEPQCGGDKPVGRRGGPAVDYKEVLEPDQFAIYSRLRDWRKQRAVADQMAGTFIRSRAVGAASAAISLERNPWRRSRLKPLLRGALSSSGLACRAFAQVKSIREPTVVLASGCRAKARRRVAFHCVVRGCETSGYAALTRPTVVVGA